MIRLQYLLLLPLLLILFTPGCTTIYGAAVDERNVETIASDHKIKANILKAFSDDKTVGVLDFSVSSYEGHVFLIGEYETQAQKNRAIQIARNQQGVNNLTHYMIADKDVPFCGTSANLRLTAEVTALLIGDKQIKSTNIDVKTMQCITVLWGLVGSSTEAQRAVRHAKSVDGIEKVVSFIKVKK